MSRTRRVDDVLPAEVGIIHCVNRVAHRLHLCGFDKETVRDYDHRKRWLEGRFRVLSAGFGF